MNQYVKSFINHLKKNDIKYNQEDDHVISISFKGDNIDRVKAYVFFDEDGDPYVHLKCWTISSFKNNVEKGLLLCNALNIEYRWVRFYIDKDFDLSADMDAKIDILTCGENCLFLVKRIANIVDDAYPQIAKCRWE